MPRGTVTFDLDPRSLARFKKDIRQFSKDTGLSMGDSMREVMRGVVINLSHWTPPRSKDRGEASISKDISRAIAIRPPYIIRSMLKSTKDFTPHPAKSIADVTAAHQAARGPRGTVPRGYVPTVAATLGMATTEYERAIRKVGKLKAGWNKAAEIWKVRVAKWVWRHGTGFGTAEDAIRANGTGWLEATNKIPYVARQTGLAVRALNVAKRQVYTRLMKRLQKETEKANRKK